MKKFKLILLGCLFAASQMFAQVVTHETDLILADIDCQIDSTHGITTSNDSTSNYLIVSNDGPRMAYLQYAVGAEVIDSASLDLYWYVVDALTPINIDYMVGLEGINDTTNLSTLDRTKFTRLVDKTTVATKNVFTPYNVTTAYNAAVNAGKSNIVFLVSIDPTDTTNAQLKFKTVRQRDNYNSKAAQLVVTRNCPWYEVAIDSTVCEGSTFTVNGKSLTEEGVIVDTLANACGSDSINTYYVMFISDAPVVEDYTICPGSSQAIQIGPRQYSEYTEAGTYYDTIMTDGCQKIITTNLTIGDAPSVVDLGADAEIKESETHTLDAGAGFASYVWKNDGIVISGETSQTLVVSMSKEAFHPGVNEVEVIVGNDLGCTAGSNVVWVEIKGNLFTPVKDSYVEEISDKYSPTSTALRVKKDSDIPVDPDPDFVPLWNREVFLEFDLSNETITDAMSNYKLRLYLYAVSVGNGVKEDGIVVAATPFYQTVHCKFVAGGFDETGTWASRPTEGLKTLSAPLDIRIDSLTKGFVEWDINAEFVKEILDKNLDIFTIGLSAPNDLNSHLTTFYSTEYKNISWHPVITYEVGTTSIKEFDESSIGKFTLYPNPTKGKLSIESAIQFTSYSIVDLSGRQVVSKQLKTSAIDVSALESGCYIIRLKNASTVGSKIFIKE